MSFSWAVLACGKEGIGSGSKSGANLALPPTPAKLEKGNASSPSASILEP